MIRNLNPETINWMDYEDLICIPFISDPFKHYTKTNISFIYFYNIKSRTEFIINCKHHDDIQYSYSWIKDITCKNKLFTYNSFNLKKYKIKGYDIDLCNWLYTNNIIKLTQNSNINTYYNWYNKSININNIVPIVHLIQECIDIKDRFLEVYTSIEFDKALEYYNNIVLPTLNYFNNQELRINEDICQKHFNKKLNLINTTYDIYTTTGRPSNTTNGINLAALNKTDGSRNIIQSEENSLLFEFDFTAFQVNLVADLIGYKFPNGDIHTYLGQQYYNKQDLNQNEYDESKLITFQCIYGFIHPKYKEIKFINEVQLFRENLFYEFNNNGYIKMPLSKRKLRKNNYDKLTPTKLFNYVIQGMETEFNILILYKLFKLLQNKKSKLLLYTYDSFLFNIDKDDTSTILTEIFKILNFKNYSTKSSYGLTYNNMKKIKLIA